MSSQALEFCPSSKDVIFFLALLTPYSLRVDTIKVVFQPYLSALSCYAESHPSSFPESLPCPNVLETSSNHYSILFRTSSNFFPKTFDTLHTCQLPRQFQASPHRSPANIQALCGMMEWIEEGQEQFDLRGGAALGAPELAFVIS